MHEVSPFSGLVKTLRNACAVLSMKPGALRGDALRLIRAFASSAELLPGSRIGQLHNSWTVQQPIKRHRKRFGCAAPFWIILALSSHPRDITSQVQRPRSLSTCGVPIFRIWDTKTGSIEVSPGKTPSSTFELVKISFPCALHKSTQQFAIPNSYILSSGLTHTPHHLVYTPTAMDEARL